MKYLIYRAPLKIALHFKGAIVLITLFLAGEDISQILGSESNRVDRGGSHRPRGCFEMFLDSRKHDIKSSVAAISPCIFLFFYAF